MHTMLAYMKSAESAGWKILHKIFLSVYVFQKGNVRTVCPEVSQKKLAERREEVWQQVFRNKIKKGEIYGGKKKDNRKRDTCPDNMRSLYITDKQSRHVLPQVKKQCKCSKRENQTDSRYG